MEADHGGSVTAEAAAALKTAMAALLFDTPTWLLAAVNIVQLACSVSNRLLVGQSDVAADKPWQIICVLSQRLICRHLL